MKLKKLLIFSLCLLTLFTVSFTFKTTPSVKATSEDFQYVPRSDGGDATYLNQRVKVEIPKTYEKQTTEFRGVWVSPFAADISGFNYGKEATQSTLLSVLNTMERYNLNTIVFHIRTHNDALYDTKLAPKSPYVRDVDFKEWDYLTWFIDECHKRGIEFHAWMNPYRLTMNKPTTVDDILEKYKDYPNNPASKEENILIGEDGSILDPGSPEVRDYLVDVCMEVIEKYDVDAIHFDDYFYMKGINDKKTYDKYHEKYNTNDREEFRRLQIDEFIEELSKKMYKYNQAKHKAVQFGISPSGCYRNGGYTTKYEYDANGTLVYPLASNSAGYAHYDYPLYSDVKKWIDNEWIDYVVPQLYGSFENIGTRYCDLIDWWSAVCRYKRVNFYPGIGIYQINTRSDKGWYTEGLKTFSSSLLYGQKKEEVKGFCLYSYKTLNLYGSRHPDFKTVFETMLDTKALNPKSQRYHLKVSAPTFNIYKGNGNYTIKIDPVDNATKYAIYKSSSNINVNEPGTLLTVVSGKDMITYVDKESRSNINYGVVAINQANVKSSLKTINTKDAKTSIDFPFGKLNDLTFTGEVKPNGFIHILIDQAEIYAGLEARYELYVSYDNEHWELEKEFAPTNDITIKYRYKYNDNYRPVFMKLVAKNEFGELETQVIKIDYENIKASTILDYMLDRINNQVKDIFN